MPTLSWWVAGLRGCSARGSSGAAGVDVLVLEAAEAPGGRVRTDVVDGFRCDRGFQLLNPAYPAVRRHVDVDGPRPAAVRPGCRGGDGRRRGHGRRTRCVIPGRWPTGPAQRLRCDPASWRGWPAGWPRRWGRCPTCWRAGRALAGSLGPAGVDGRLRREVLEPFLAGVLAERRRATPRRPSSGCCCAASSARPRRSRARDAGVPRPAGRPAPVGRSDPARRCGRCAPPPRARRCWPTTSSYGPGRGGGRRPVGPPRTCWDLPRPTIARAADLVVRLRPAAHRGCEPPPGRRPGRDRGSGRQRHGHDQRRHPPTRRPGGTWCRPTALLPADAGEPDVAATSSELLRDLDATAGRSVVRHDVPEALPLVPPPLRSPAPVDLGDGLFVAGDHRDTSGRCRERWPRAPAPPGPSRPAWPVPGDASTRRDRRCPPVR